MPVDLLAVLLFA